MIAGHGVSVLSRHDSPSLKLLFWGSFHGLTGRKPARQQACRGEVVPSRTPVGTVEENASVNFFIKTGETGGGDPQTFILRPDVTRTPKHGKLYGDDIILSHLCKEDVWASVDCRSAKPSVKSRGLVTPEHKSSRVKRTAPRYCDRRCA